MQSMNSSQGDKSHSVMLYSICFHTEWMNWLQWFNSMPDWQVVELKLNGLSLARLPWAGATPPRSIVLSIKAAGSHNWGGSLKRHKVIMVALSVWFVRIWWTTKSLFSFKNFYLNAHAENLHSMYVITRYHLQIFPKLIFRWKRSIPQ